MRFLPTQALLDEILDCALHPSTWSCWQIPDFITRVMAYVQLQGGNLAVAYHPRLGWTVLQGNLIVFSEGPVYTDSPYGESVQLRTEKRYVSFRKSWRYYYNSLDAPVPLIECPPLSP